MTKSSPLLEISLYLLSSLEFVLDLVPDLEDDFASGLVGLHQCVGLLDTVQREGGVNDGPELAAAEVGQGPLCKFSYQRFLVLKS